MQKKKVGLENYVTTRENPDLSSSIRLTADKVAQCILVAKNRREKKGQKSKQQKR